MAVFRISAKAETSCKAGHPWIYSDEITEIDGEYENGDIVTDDFIKKVGVGQYDAAWESIKGEWFFEASDGIVKTETADGFAIAGIKDGAYLYYQNVLHVPENAEIHLRVANGGQTPGRVEVREGGPDGEMLGEVTVGNTGGCDRFETFDVALQNAAGTHGLCFVFRCDAEDTMRFEDFCF